MELREIKVYDFEELSKDTREKVLDNFREQNDFYFLEDDLNEELNQLLEDNKIKVLDKPILRYSLSYSQGDGVSFCGLFEYKGFDFRIVEGNLSNLYSHKYTTDININYYDEGDDLNEELSEIIFNEFREIYFNICDTLENSGCSQIEHENSDEAIKENIKLNEYEFLENGDLF